MKFFIVLAVLFCAICALTGTNSAPAVPSEDAVSEAALGNSVVEQHEQLESAPSRQKRATCDLLSGTGINHSACAAHCLLRGNRGGYCSGKGVCICRK